MRTVLLVIALLALAWAFFASGGLGDVEGQSPAPSVDLRVTPTQTGLGQPVMLSLTALHPITASANMTADLYIRIPSGWSVSNQGMAQSCAAGCHATYSFAPGQSRSIQVEAIPSQPGTFTVEATVSWRMGDETGEVQAQAVEVAVIEAAPTQVPDVSGGEQDADGGPDLVQVVGGLVGGSVIGIVLLGIFTNVLSSLVNFVTGKVFSLFGKGKGQRG